MKIIEEDVSPQELQIAYDDFNEHTKSQDIKIEDQKRIGFKVMDCNNFVGFISGLTNSNWFYISDLWLNEAYRNDGIGSKLLSMIEDRAKKEGCEYIYTYTISYQAPNFYKKHGYKVFGELENWHKRGVSRYGFKKPLHLRVSAVKTTFTN